MGNSHAEIRDGQSAKTMLLVKCPALNRMSLLTPPGIREHQGSGKKKRKSDGQEGMLTDAELWTGYGQCTHELTESVLTYIRPM